VGSPKPTLTLQDIRTLAGDFDAPLSPGTYLFSSLLASIGLLDWLKCLTENVFSMGILRIEVLDNLLENKHNLDFEDREEGEW
jgi:hypothetical protein